MGFPRDLCEKATEATKNEGLDSAINWMLANKIVRNACFEILY